MSSATRTPRGVPWSALDLTEPDGMISLDLLELTADGYRVAVVQNPTLSLDGDVAATHQILDGLDGPAVLVGHSYGGVVITEAGNASFAADVPAKLAAFMADSQVPWGVDALAGSPAEPAWRTKPSWYLVATDDHMIPPPAQRAMAERAGATVSETPGSHAVYVSRPAVVAAVIAQAAQGLNGQG